MTIKSLVLAGLIGVAGLSLAGCVDGGGYYVDNGYYATGGGFYGGYPDHGFYRSRVYYDHRRNWRDHRVHGSWNNRGHSSHGWRGGHDYHRGRPDTHGGGHRGPGRVYVRGHHRGMSDGR